VSDDAEPADHELLPRFDARSRRLCPDGACVGLVGPDGRCRLCGTVDPGAASGLGPEAFAGGCAQDDEGAEEDADADTSAMDELGGEGGFDPRRRLCPDGACVGVIGANGACGACGRRDTT
jgi:hypothetical protein